ncbi:MAG: 6,7-dimethyl-8-ribityllumazine synthase [Candidatus Accumulibacter sp.]|uniref:6,7-dimethyl-8-ribityllumazine synthase n=1 Tax=Accumulibacter sp. TaxID=2053492 RepID=UPI001A532474|nr:6,7-dimethyl-8-ribityllumazine synthase [Accumulibacter sp.]MBL8394396.1 6,7-dimethyl-8-ribityllumazine synthase [Accumulibacter sp.]
MGTPKRLATTPRAANGTNIHEYEVSLHGTGLAIGIVMSRFNQDIGEGLLSACIDELKRLGVGEDELAIATVPGALEVPLVLQTMARSGRFDALIALGAVIRGETYHFEIVANDSCRALMEVQLASQIPIANGILTCEDDDQALVRMHRKGSDCAQAAIEMANLLRAIRETT